MVSETALEGAKTSPIKKGPKDVNAVRGRWWHRAFFIFGSIGASIGLPNIWKFPQLTFKHTGPLYLWAYIGAIIVVGWPMHILESTLGQKMQRGSAGALRGITPRLAGAGWVASFCGLVMSFVYSVLLGLNLYYFVIASGEPWTEENYLRPISCETADRAKSSSNELFLFFNVVKVLDEKTC
jgi:SNF family Na+-dependent transporter